MLDLPQLVPIVIVIKPRCVCCSEYSSFRPLHPPSSVDLYRRMVRLLASSPALTTSVFASLKRDPAQKAQVFLLKTIRNVSTSQRDVPEIVSAG